MILRPAARAAHSLTLLGVLVGGMALGAHPSGQERTASGPSLGASSGATTVAPALAATPSAPAGSAVAAGARHRVGYRGVSVEVPSAWPVINLDENPTDCVRMDQPAVYLGTPGTDQQCPARLVGGADTIWLAPTNAADRTATTTVAGAQVRGDRTVRSRWNAASRTGVSVVQGADVSVRTTSSSGSDPTDALLASIAVTGSTPATKDSTPPTRPSKVTSTPSTSPAAYAQSLATAAPSGKSLTGMWFDTCAAPSATTMATWKASSPYAAVGVYIGGPLRGCGQPNLTSSWVSTVTKQGWGLVPIYVGYQAPCVQASLTTFTAANAASVGTSSAVDAAAKARALGLAAGSTIQYDLENYATGNASCTKAVLTMVSAWTTEIRRQGFAAGVYGNTGSLMTDMSTAVRSGSTTFVRPDQVWYAVWNGLQTTNTGSTSFPDSYWAGQRYHQYRGDFTETWGGVSLNIDASWSTAPTPGNPTQVSYGTNVLGPGSAGFVFTGSMAYWRPSPGSGAMGRAYWTYTSASTTEYNGATWSPTLAPGTYAVDVNVPGTVAAKGIAHYTVTDAAGSHSIALDQSTASGYRTLGSTFVVTTGHPLRLHLGDNEPSSRKVITADAARFRQIVPSASKAVSAAPGAGRAVVTFTAAAGNGAPITSYTIVASPGGARTTVPGTRLWGVVGGLTDGTAYRFSVTAANAGGSGPASALSAPAVPTPLTRTVPVVRTRVLDTRNGAAANPTLKTALAAKQTVVVKVAGVTGSPVPSTASGVWLSANVMTPAAAGQVVIGSSGSIAHGAGIAANGSMLVRLERSDGAITVTNASSGTVHVSLDVQGYVISSTTGSSLLVPVTGTRLLDTTTGTATSSQRVAIASHGAVTVQVAGGVGSPVPVAARAVVAAVTVKARTAGGSVLVDNGTAAHSSWVVFNAGQQTSVTTLPELSAKGTLTLVNNAAAPVDVTLDVLGYLSTTTGSRWTTTPATRIIDTRTGTMASPKAGALAPGQTVRVRVAGTLGTPIWSGATSVLVNVSAMSGTRAGQVRLAPGGSAATTTALAYPVGATVSGTALVKVAADGTIGLTNTSTGTVQVTLDVQGFSLP